MDRFQVSRHPPEAGAAFVRLFRRTASVFSISRESCSSDVARHADGTDKSAIGQDCLRPCGALFLLVTTANHVCEQRDVVANLPP